MISLHASILFAIYFYLLTFSVPKLGVIRKGRRPGKRKISTQIKVKHVFFFCKVVAKKFLFD